MNVVIIVGDGLRIANLGCYGNPGSITPTIDALAREGVLFQDAYSCTNHTDPSFTTILTGKHPVSHGIVHHGSTSHGVTEEELRMLARTGTRLLPELLQANSYYTMAFDWLGRWHRRGYDFYGETEGLSPLRMVERLLGLLPESSGRRAGLALSRAGVTLPSRSGRSYTRLARRLIRHHHRRHFFILLHNWDTHTPFDRLLAADVRRFCHDSSGERVSSMLRRIKNPRWREIVRRYHLLGVRYVSQIPAMYQAAAHAFDRSVGELLETLHRYRVLDETIVIVTADHGDNPLRDGVFVGHFGLYDPVVHVPLVISGPGLPRGKVVSGFVQHTDLTPTLLEMLGIPHDPSEMDGQSLIPAIQGLEVPSSPFVIAQDAAARTRYSIRTTDHKLIHSPTPHESLVEFDTIGCRFQTELYDLKADPEETDNLVDRYPEVAAELGATLLARIAELEQKRDSLIARKERDRLRNRISALRGAGVL